jgi:hypothetical protein
MSCLFSEKADSRISRILLQLAAYTAFSRSMSGKRPHRSLDGKTPDAVYFETVREEKQQA